MFIIICQLYGSLFSNHLPFSNRYGRLIGYHRLISCRYCAYELLLTAMPIFFKISVWYILIRTLCNFCYIIFKNIDSIKYSEGQLLFHNKNNNIGINFSRIFQGLLSKNCKWAFWHPNLPGNLPQGEGGLRMQYSKNPCSLVYDKTLLICISLVQKSKKKKMFPYISRTIKNF